MKCPSCQFEHPASKSFCGRCGSRLDAACPRCGTAAPASFRFCGECGTSLGTPASQGAAVDAEASGAGYTPAHLTRQLGRPPSAVEGEKKQVTVLFCDLVQSTALADRVGAETMHGLLNQFFEMALAEVHRFEGTLNQFLGDGFMALFGAPIAHEDHPRRAVLAALGLRRRLEERRDEFRRRHGAELEVRMGLNTGMVVVGGIGDRLRTDYTAVGDTTNLAARLQSLAEPGAILLSEAVYRKVRQAIEVEELPPARVKGKSEPIASFRVLGEKQRPDPRPATRRALSAFVGRERELAVLEDLWSKAVEGRGQAVGITGEAGSGKSRLLLELRRRFAAAPVTRLQGRCLSYGGGIPFLPLAHMLRTAGGIAESDPPPAVAEKLERNFLRLGIEPGESMPELLHLLGVKEGSEALAELEPQVVQNRIFEALRRVFTRAAELRPVVLELEDLHWIDATSEALLGRLVEGLSGMRLLLLATFRLGYRPPWTDHSWATQISVQRLSRQESQRVVESILDQAGIAPGGIETVLTKAEGNPFFLEELAWSLAEDGGDEAAVPDTIQDLLTARIDRLPEEHKRLIQTASVLGREFSPTLLAAVWERRDNLESLLADLKRWELLSEIPSSDAPAVQFHHALTQEVAYQSLLSSRRRALHLAAGRSLEALYADHPEDAYDRLAYHFPRAGAPAEAVTYLDLFAEKAARNWAHTEAAAALEAALNQAALLDDAVREQRLIELTLRLAESLLPLARIPQTLDLLEQQRGRVERLADCALTGRYHFWLAHTQSYLGNQAEAARHALRSLETAHRCGDDPTRGKAGYVLSRNDFWAGRFSAGLAYGLEAAELLEAAGERWWQGQALWVNGFHHFVLGHHDAALEAMGRARVIGEALADYRLDTSWSTGYFLASLGDYEAGIAACRGGLERARDPLNSSAALGFLGYAYLEKGDLEAAVESLERAVEQLEGSGMQPLLGWFSVYLAQAHLQAGRLDAAVDHVLAGMRTTRKAGFLLGLALAKRTLGCVALERGDTAAAQAPLFEACGDFVALEVPLELARTHLALAQLCRAQGDAGAAAEHLSRARRRFADLRMPAHVERIDDDLLQLDMASPAEAV